MKPIIVYMTCPSAEEARKIVNNLLEQRLIACANIMAPHKALYRWQGRVERSEEVAVILKSREDLFTRIEKEICRLHSYECPCIVSWPIGAGYAPYLQWLADETAEVK